MVCAAAALLEQLAEGGDVNLSHLQSLRFGELLVAFQVWDDAPEPVECDVESQHPSPFSGVRGEAPTSLRPLQCAFVRLEIVQRAAGRTQTEFNDGARSVSVVAAFYDALCSLSLLRTGSLQKSMNIGVENRLTGGSDSSLRIHRDIRRKEAFARRHLYVSSSEPLSPLQQSLMGEFMDWSDTCTRIACSRGAWRGSCAA